MTSSSSSSPTKPANSVPEVTTSQYHSMIEARDLSWVDTFFDDEQGVVAVFDLDYEKMENFQTQVAIVSQASVMAFMSMYGLCIHPFALAAAWGVYGLSCTPCLTQYQIQWQVRAQHVAITQDGIRFVQDKRKSGCGWSMCDKGKHSKTVPFDKITDCDIVEPAGNECLCIPRVLMTVIVDTASSGGTLHDLAISGLKDPHAFKQLVWAMKRARGSDMGKHFETPQTLSVLERGGRDTNTGVGGVSALLKEIRDELRENNTLLRKLHDTTTTRNEEGSGSGDLESAATLMASEKEIV